MIRVGINGLGRIGRAILRSNLNKKLFQVVAVNDINPEIENMAYTLNYDTLYDRLEDPFECGHHEMHNSQGTIKVFHESHIDEVDWESQNVDIVIDSSGVYDNLKRAKSAIERNNIKKVIVTHSPNDYVDFTMVLGANEELLDVDKHHVISSSICDATAIGPVLKIIKENFGIETGYVTTMHPWLSYQNLMDGPASSWSVPGEIYHHYALGRSAIGTMIPKPTSAVEATCKVVSDISENIIGSYSIRTPTSIVGAADITLNLRKETSADELKKVFDSVARNQYWQVILNNYEPLVSLDFKKSEYSAAVDHRFTQVVGGKMVKMVLWYDNEWGYATRVCDQVAYIGKKLNLV